MEFTHLLIMGLQQSLTILSNAKAKRGDHPTVAMRSEVINSVIDAIHSLARGENIGRGRGIRRSVGQGTVTFVADIPRSRRGLNSTSKTPFLVYASNDTNQPPAQIIKVYPGKIAGIIPTLGGALLTIPDDATGAHPWFYPPNAPFSFFLRCKIGLDITDAFRPTITEVLVLTDDDPLAIPDIEGEEIPELKMFWDNDEKTQGHFYIRVADVDMTANELDDTPIFKSSSQWLYSNYASFAVSDTEVIIIV